MNDATELLVPLYEQLANVEAAAGQASMVKDTFGVPVMYHAHWDVHDIIDSNEHAVTDCMLECNYTTCPTKPPGPKPLGPSIFRTCGQVGVHHLCRARVIAEPVLQIVSRASFQFDCHSGTWEKSERSCTHLQMTQQCVLTAGDCLLCRV